MSRAAFLIALHEALGRLPTDAERRTFLASMARQCGGERIYVAHRQLTDAEAEAEIARLQALGWSVRRIAGAVGRSKSSVQRALGVPTCPYERDSA